MSMSMTTTLVKMAKQQYTMWVERPNRALITFLKDGNDLYPDGIRSHDP
jgi:hypothetical protein